MERIELVNGQPVCPKCDGYMGLEVAFESLWDDRPTYEDGKWRYEVAYDPDEQGEPYALQCEDCGFYIFVECAEFHERQQAGHS